MCGQGVFFALTAMKDGSVACDGLRVKLVRFDAGHTQKTQVGTDEK